VRSKRDHDEQSRVGLGEIAIAGRAICE